MKISIVTESSDRNALVAPLPTPPPPSFKVENSRVAVFLWQLLTITYRISLALSFEMRLFHLSEHKIVNRSRVPVLAASARHEHREQM